MKHLLFVLFGLFCLQACSQSPSNNAANGGDLTQPNATPTGEATVLSTSPNQQFRLVKTSEEANGKTIHKLTVVRLSDMQQSLVCRTQSAEPKTYWSEQTNILLCEAMMGDSVNEHEVAMFDLLNFTPLKNKQGLIAGYDNTNEVVVIFRLTPERQVFGVINLKNPKFETQREIITPYDGKLPVVTMVAAEKQARIKAYTTGGAAVNTAFKY